MDLQEIKEKLLSFQQNDKFKVYQHLQPAVENSTPDTIGLVNGIFNRTTENLLSSLNTNGFREEEIKQIILKTIDEFEKEDLDTEDFEFCYELLFVLSEITGVNIRPEIDKQQAEKLTPEAMIEYIKNAGLDPKDFGF